MFFGERLIDDVIKFSMTRVCDTRKSTCSIALGSEYDSRVMTA